jgi:hypothetical protein
MKKYFLTLTALLFFLNANAQIHRGTEGVGGGDPHAIEFLKIADSIQEFLSSSNMFPEIEREDFKSVITTIRLSLDNGSNKPQIIFQESEVLCAGVSKVGCVTENKNIFVHRQEWKTLNAQEKIELVSLEVLQLLNFTGRYSLAQSMGSFSKEILKTKAIPQGLSCMTIAIERARQEARRQYPDYMFMTPTKATYVGVEDHNGVIKNKYQVDIQVTTGDDYMEDLTLEYKFLNKNCIQ